MKDRKVNIIAIQERYLDIITKQIKEVLGDTINVHPITVKDLQSDTVEYGDIVVISSSQIKGLITQLIPKDCPCIVAKRDINFMNTKELLNLPPNQEILVVNDNKINAKETVQSLRETIFEHNYIAYTPEDHIPQSINYIVTPGERHLLPRGLTNVIDIGPRLLDISTFEKIVHLLDINYPMSQIVKRYFKACVSLSGRNKEEIQSNKDIRNVAQYYFDDIISVSELMKKAVERAKRYAKDSHAIHIHIEGEPGTGKSMFAQAIHNYSTNAERSFISINCSSSDFTIEKLLFGSEEGGEISYGLFELAENGTVCIEEIGELPLSIQKQLYHVLEKGKFLRLSGNELLPLQCRVITTNSKSCKELVEKELFRHDLYNLLTKYSLKIPALSERKEDLLPLIHNVKKRIKRNNIEFTNEVITFFEEYNWDNNVKHLYNVITYLAFLNGDHIGIESLPFHLRSNYNQQKFNVFEVNNKVNKIIVEIEKHGFLDENIKILNAFYEGKKERVSYGRKALKVHLEKKGLILSEQQLRMRLEVLQDLGLIIVRQGRAGSTISRQGEEFLREFYKTGINV
ncbi:sigma 54-interacting transcriptional regulator [Virgibacillus ndiopensis]|uniref:sigma 54-interacting transcriptional regulator n=1 Tax=Virgibacillus ndiopensis TaxID=2004408 RepID=UPI000C08C248|nr:sigma 54-interacting transcriptional regulator [Virgibacillus ndiopensis]